mmetsp:Transcript_19645/g.49603  ORF Transcript_19645/g.49603 Transcript_19645/m.49603 type:complete len:198 (-) Transcript_19645:625-1218(-)
MHCITTEGGTALHAKLAGGMPDPKPPPGEQWSYCDRRYWDTRYQRALGSSAAPAARSASSSGEEDSAVFDWLCDATSLAALARRSWAGRDPVVLDMGCGNSELPEALARGDRSDVGGWQRAGFVLGSDYSSSGVLQLMASRAAAGGLGGYIDYMIDDVRALPLRSATVDVVIDKGCLDSVLQDADQVMAWPTGCQCM